MANKGFGIFAFIVGGVIGFVAANVLLKNKYECITQDEIDSVKTTFDRIRKEREKAKEDLDKVEEEYRKRKEAIEKEKEEIKKEYKKVVESLGYSEDQPERNSEKPYVISPDDFGSIDEYERIGFTLYADGTVTDDCDRALSDEEIECSIGKESLNHVGDYEEDSVYVRNDRLKVDYEVLTDLRSYADILRENPYLRL